MSSPVVALKRFTEMKRNEYRWAIKLVRKVESRLGFFRGMDCKMCDTSISPTVIYNKE